MLRSAWKLPYISLLFFQKRFLKSNSFILEKIHLRNSIIPTIFMDNRIKINIYNGIWYLSINLTNMMIGCKFGEFSYTKRSDKQTHLKQKRKKKSSSKK
jgi:ribosomal protein S19